MLIPAVGFFEGPLEPNKIYPLPSVGSVNDAKIDVYVNPKDSIDVFWDKNKQQHCVKLKANVREKVSIAYKFKQNPKYEFDDAFKVQPSVPDKLPKEIEDALRELILGQKPIPELQFIFDNALSLTEKTKKLIAYCHFKPVKSNPNSNSHLKQICELIRHRQGECRHNSYAFCLLSRLMQVNSRIISNENHMFCEMLEAENSWRRVDLGGAPVNDLTPEDVRLNPFESLENRSANNVESKDESESKVANSDRKISDAFSRRYDRRFKQKGENLSVNLSALKKLFHPVIELQPGQTAFDINAAIIKDGIKLNPNFLDNYLYIDNPFEFNAYFDTFYLQDNRFQTKPGLLRKLMQEGGTLVVNWSNFSADEIANYKAILDKKPRLFNEPISPELKIIGISDGEKACSAFFTRAQSVSFEVPKLTISEPEEINALRVDLYHSHKWRELLYGKIRYAGKQTFMLPGILLEAIKSNRPIVIENPPVNDRDFDLLMHRLTVENRILFNGEFIKVGENVRVKQVNIARPKIIYPNIKIMHAPKDSLFAYPHPHFLNMQNSHECLEQLVIHENGEAENIAGKIAQYDARQHVFYVTSHINQSEWAQLEDEIKKYPNIDFKFILAPGVKLGDYDKNNSSASVESSVALPLHKFSNDIDYTSEQIDATLSAAGAKTIRIEVNAQTTFNDLVYDIASDTKHGFKLHFKDLWLAIKHGLTVILNGEMSPQLYQQLLPLLSEKPFMVINGKHIDLSGRRFPPVVAVMPEKMKSILQLHPASAVHYNFDDYEKIIAPENAHQKDMLARLKHFYKCANQVKHTGVNKPASLALSHALLTKMLDQLSEQFPLHQQNPIKSFLLHYDKDSEDYAYLNMSAKLIFNRNLLPKINIRKLAKLRKRIDMNNRQQCQLHIWQILNCFNAASLKMLLNQDIANRLLDNPSMEVDPHIIDQVMQGLPKLLKRKNILEKVTPKFSLFGKQYHQLQKLIQSSNSQIIFLKGWPGLGKTRAVRETLGGWYEGDQEFIRWLENPDKVFLIDEGNMRSPGQLEFMKALAAKNKRFMHHGKIYEITNKHKIIITGNPESFPGRFYHHVLLHYADVIYFKKPDDQELGNILNSLLPESLQNQHDIILRMLASLNLIEKFNPYLALSFRDWKSLIARFTTLVKQNPNKMDALYFAVLCEFAPAIKTHEQREQFIHSLQSIFERARVDEPVSMISVTHEYAISSSKSYVLMAMDQLLMMRQRVISGESLEFKNAVIFEGDSGEGKSTLLEAVLAKQGVNKSAEGQKKLYTLTAGTDALSKKIIYDTLHKAFHEGAFVILDEIDLDPALEKYLTQYLSGLDMFKQPAKKPGFILLSTKNESTKEGRKTVSKAIVSRSQYIYMDAHTEREVAAIAKHNKMPYPAEFARSFKKAVKNNPKKINMRTAYQVIDETEADNFLQFKDYLDQVPVNEFTKYALIETRNIFNLLATDNVPGRCGILLGFLLEFKDRLSNPKDPAAVHMHKFVDKLCREFAVILKLGDGWMSAKDEFCSRYDQYYMHLQLKKNSI